MTTNLFDLGGRVALVTGASRGLGRGMALALARAGADVVVTSRTMSSLDGICSAIEDLGRHAFPVQLDVREQESISAGCRRRGHAGGPRRHPRQQRRLQRAQAGSRSELGRLEPRPRHEPAWRVLRVAGACSGDDRARVGPDRQHRLAHERLRLRRSRPVHGEPRRHPPAHHEPRRRVGRARRHRQLPCPGWFHTAQNDVMFRDEEWVSSLSRANSDRSDRDAGRSGGCGRLLRLRRKLVRHRTDVARRRGRRDRLHEGDPARRSPLIEGDRSCGQMTRLGRCVLRAASAPTFSWVGQPESVAVVQDLQLVCR